MGPYVALMSQVSSYLYETLTGFVAINDTHQPGVALRLTPGFVMRPFQGRLFLAPSPPLWNYPRPRSRLMSRNSRLEVAEAPPARRLAQVDFGDRHGAPLGRLREDFARAIVDGRDHPIE